MKLDNIKNKRVLVVGLGVTGESVVRYLGANGVAFDVADDKAESSDFPADSPADLPEHLPGYLPGYLKAQWSSSANVQMHRRLTAELCCNYDVLVISPGVPRSLPALRAAQEHGVDIIGDIELFAHAIGDTPVIAVTGSNGKSTVVSWIAHVLKRCGVRAKLCGNIGLPVLDSIDSQADIYVLELSSYQLESTVSLATLSATVLNISDDHMDRYSSIDQYAAVKRRVYSHCQHVVVNLDDARTHVQPDLMQNDLVQHDGVRQAYKLTGDQPPADPQSGAQQPNNSAALTAASNDATIRVTAFSLSALADARYHLSDAANDAWLCRGDQKLVRRSLLNVPGDHNVANALAVLALLEPVELDADQLLQGLKDFHGLEHRTEFVLQSNGVRYYNDSKGTNIDACEKAILAMNAPVVLIAGGLGKGADFQTLRATVTQHVKAMVLIGEDAPVLREALLDTTHIVEAASLLEAVQRCAELAIEGDVVLLSPACASFDMFANFEQRGTAFKQAVEAIAA